MLADSSLSPAGLYWLLFLLIIPARCVPVRLSTTKSATDDELLYSWIPEPSGRGTFGIFISCVLTIFLCIWTTVQVNIEPPDRENSTFKNIPLLKFLGNEKSRRFIAKRWVRKMGWSITCMFFPELCMCIAAYERATARRLRAAIKNAEKENAEKEGAEKEGAEKEGAEKEKKKDSSEWDDLCLSYYAIMGGFRVEAKGMNQPSGGSPSATSPTGTYAQSAKGTAGSKSDSPLTDEYSRHDRDTLTPQGVLALAKNGALPSVTALDIRDKSKANSLVKILVCIQALWLIIQVIARTASHLQVTVLEVHTVLHALCALTMYITWWDKPVDVERSTIIEETPKLLSYLEEPTANPTNLIKCHHTKEKHEESYKEACYFTTRAGLGKLMYQQVCDHENILSPQYFEILGKAFGNLVAAKSSLWKEGVFISIVGIAYGGAHLTTWNNDFASLYELWIWRISAMITAITFGCFVIIAIFGTAFGVKRENRLFRNFCGITVGLCLFPVGIARLFLFIEPFIALRALPKEAYDSVKWVEIWPHVS